MEVNTNGVKADIRKLKDIVSVVYDKNWLKTADLDLGLYYMHRGVKKDGDLRYDITIIPPKLLGQEFSKTKGHEHIGNYPEVYIVLEGEAIFLMQSRIKNSEVSDAYAVKAFKGDAVIIPSLYGHITINPSLDKELKMANWISIGCKSDYSLYEKMKGACYYYIFDGKKAEWIKNDNYKNIPPLRFKETLKSVPENLNFLNNN